MRPASRPPPVIKFLIAVGSDTDRIHRVLTRTKAAEINNKNDRSDHERRPTARRFISGRLAFHEDQDPARRRLVRKNLRARDTAVSPISRPVDDRDHRRRLSGRPCRRVCAHDRPGHFIGNAFYRSRDKRDVDREDDGSARARRDRVKTGCGTGPDRIDRIDIPRGNFFFPFFLGSPAAHESHNE